MSLVTRSLEFLLPTGGCWADMGWLRLVGSLKLQVSFAEYCLFYRSLLQKRPVIWRSLLVAATPHGWFIFHMWMSHVQHMNESCRTKEWVMSHIGISHINMCRSHVTYSLLFLLPASGCWDGIHEWFILHIWMSHVHMSNMWMSHVARKKQSCPT